MADVFMRFEKKYLLYADVFQNIKKELSRYMEPDVYMKNGEPYDVLSLYYDTQDAHLIRTSMQKPRYKEKLRIRAYGTPQKEDTVYVEIKKKVDGQGNKRRSAMPLPAAYRFLQTGILPAAEPHMNLQVLKEIQGMLKHLQLQPAMMIFCKRIAYSCKDDVKLRISFDTEIRARSDDLLLEHGTSGISLLARDRRLMEVKIGHSMPLWLSALLNRYQLYPVSFSKYGTARMNEIHRQRAQVKAALEPLEIKKTEGIEKCLTQSFR
jgi:hypothetical protein